ncbi:hypothetical protein ACFPXP_08005 [Marinicrinis lubricantis]|uniref:Uncharacterized protein n=1 Tax=Marinicrinis lubricantis TaxID=2086470 RepID=A0ABW1IMS3_9BACL
MFKLNNVFFLLACVILISAIFISSQQVTAKQERKEPSIGNMVVDWKPYTSLKELLIKSDIVVKGKVVDSNFIQLKDMPYTVHKLKINDIISGEEVESEITIGQLGGLVMNENKVEVLDNPLFEKNKHLYLFLKKVDHSSYDYHVPYDYYVIGGNQGRFKIDRECKINCVNS